MASAAATQSAINIPTLQFTDPEKALLATGLILVVASKIFPQLFTSFGWLSQYEQVSTVVSASLAGITFV